MSGKKMLCNKLRTGWTHGLSLNESCPLIRPIRSICLGSRANDMISNRYRLNRLGLLRLLGTCCTFFCTFFCIPCRLQASISMIGCHHESNRSSIKSYLDCWDLSRKNEAKVFHLHTPKVAGCSVVKDLSDMVGREQVFTDEVCFSYSSQGNYESSVVMVREPRDHVYSMYQFCHLASDPGYRLLVGKKQGLKGQEKYNLAESFDAWINEWHENPRWGDYDIYDDDEFCYCPYNMQSSRLACNSKKTAKYCHKNADFAIAMQNLKSATIIGVVEAYHESVCLFSARLTGSLPEHCDCESAAWNAYLETHVSHREDAAAEAYGSIKDVPTDVIHKLTTWRKRIGSCTRQPCAGFTEDIKEVELRFGKRILCNSELQRLQNKTTYKTPEWLGQKQKNTVFAQRLGFSSKHDSSQFDFTLVSLDISSVN